MYVVRDLNGFDAYNLCTVHEQESMVVRHERTNYTHAIAHMLYGTYVMRVYIDHILLVSVLQNFSCDSHVNVLSCTGAAKADNAFKQMLSNNVTTKCTCTYT